MRSIYWSSCTRIVDKSFDNIHSHVLDDNQFDIVLFYTFALLAGVN